MSDGLNRNFEAQAASYEREIDALKQKLAQLDKDHADDWRRIQDAERALEKEHAINAVMVEALSLARETIEERFTTLAGTLDDEVVDIVRGIDAALARAKELRGKE